MTKGKFALGAIIGAAAGVVAGMLTAPKSGKETRADLKLKADEMKADAVVLPRIVALGDIDEDELAFADQTDDVGGAAPQLGDSAPHVWTSGHPYNHQVHGVDVSRYQGNVDWHAARRAGMAQAHRTRVATRRANRKDDS